MELDEPFGKHNGDYQGKTYFKVEKKSEKGQFFGVFVKPASVKPAPEAKKPALIRPTKPVAPTGPVAAQGGKKNLSNELF